MSMEPSANEVMDALRQAQAALRMVARRSTKMAEEIAAIQRLLRQDHNFAYFEKPESSPISTDPQKVRE